MQKMIERFPDWPERLDAYIRSREGKRFAWGRDKQDCCSFAMGAVLAITGVDPMLVAGVPEYQTAEDADLILDDYPIEGTLDGLFEHRLIGMAQRGDVALVIVREEFAAMVVEGREIVGAGPHGLQRYPRSAMLKAWAI